jgi:hypothetical protein
LVYAAAMLYKATNKASYLTDAEQKYNQFNFDGKTPWAFDWDDKTIATKVRHSYIIFSSFATYHTIIYQQTK